jgi:hypothetical protein
MRRVEERVKLRCDVCHGRKKLWLGGKDYVECPNCEERGHVELVEARLTPPTTFAFTASIYNPKRG